VVGAGEAVGRLARAERFCGEFDLRSVGLVVGVALEAASRLPVLAPVSAAVA